jgi:uncharacterized membrane protein
MNDKAKRRKQEKNSINMRRTETKLANLAVLLLQIFADLGGRLVIEHRLDGLLHNGGGSVLSGADVIALKRKQKQKNSEKSKVKKQTGKQWE